MGIQHVDIRLPYCVDHHEQVPGARVVGQTGNIQAYAMKVSIMVPSGAK